MSSLSKTNEADMRRDFKRCMVQLAGVLLCNADLSMLQSGIKLHLGNRLWIVTLLLSRHAALSCCIFTGLDVEESVQVMKLLCYELMDISSNPMVLAVFKDNIEELVDVLARKTDQVRDCVHCVL
jgi:hypothetical protein